MGKVNYSKARRYIYIVAVNLAVCASLLVILEGLASYTLLLRDAMWTRSIADSVLERRHTKYDPDLGWVNEPKVYIPDMYKRGVYFRTNSRGFRSNHDFSVSVPQGKSRIICSGDSFTLGYGVDNDHTWCQLLTTLDPRLETMNMGQGGYGVDQAYLWYKRDGSKYDRQVHILAVISSDFIRMQADTFQGYGKPVMDVKDEKLVVKNVPVPKRSYQHPWLVANTENLSRLRTVEFLKRTAPRLGFAQDNSGGLSENEKNEKTKEIVKWIFKDLKLQNETRSSIFVVALLPTLHELKEGNPEQWLRFLERQSEELAIPFINVFSAFRRLPYAEILGKFGGHYNNEGNAFTARVIYDELRKHPKISHALALDRSRGAFRVETEHSGRQATQRPIPG